MLQVLLVTSTFCVMITMHQNLYINHITETTFLSIIPLWLIDNLDFEIKFSKFEKFLGAQKWVRAQMRWGSNVLGPKWVGDQISWRPNELVTKWVRGPNEWGPNKSGAKMSPSSNPAQPSPAHSRSYLDFINSNMEVFIMGERQFLHWFAIFWKN